MRTTTVVWPTTHSGILGDDSPEFLAKKERLAGVAEGLAGNQFRAELHTELNPDNTQLTVRRAWPNLETAQSWVDIVLTEGASSAQVDPE